MFSTSRLRQCVQGLDRALDANGGLFRLHYGLRNPPVGRGLGLDGVEDDGLVHCYAAALDRTQALFRAWGWPEPRRAPGGHVPVHVFRTERLGFGDYPLTLPALDARGGHASTLALRSTMDEPRAEVRHERAEVEAAHEAAHAFAHQYVAPEARHGDLWAWFDEATAVFVEGEAYPGHAEAYRFGLPWSHCPEMSLTTWGGPGGYFAAWFVRFLTHRFGVGLLREIWAGSEEKYGPLEVLERLLVARGTSVANVFWDYCREGYADPAWATGVGLRFGPRSVTESFRASGGVGGTDELARLSCRYYRLTWDHGPSAARVIVEAEGPWTDNELRAGLLTLDPYGRIVAEADLPLLGGSGIARTGRTRRAPDGGHTALVVARVRPAAVRRPAPEPPVHVRVRVDPCE